MDTHDMMVELLAIKLYEHDEGTKVAWSSIIEEDRQIYRDLVNKAQVPADMYDERKT